MFYTYNMKSIVLILTLSFGLLSLIPPPKNVNSVYICNGKSSKKFHYKINCRGLSNCSTKIELVSLADAKKLGRTVCGWED
jgi:hypothetical protein